jgi:hypothetical protein
LKKIIKFWKQAKEQDPLCFWLEMLGTLVTIGASMTLAINADNPDMRIVYPGFMLGSALAIFTYTRRKLAWPLVMVYYFFTVNIFGFCVAMGWL